MMTLDQRIFNSAIVLFSCIATFSWAQTAGLEPRIGERITQEQVANEFSIKRIRAEGMRMFSTPFNTLDGYGDGPFTPGVDDGVTFGQRPSLQSSQQVFLRMNGLDSQSCLECHSVVSNATIPATFGVGGAGGISASAFPEMTDVDFDDSEGNGFARTEGRTINPPFNFGLGGIELLAKEMTSELQAIKQLAQANPGEDFDLITKGVYFGYIRFENSALVTSNIEGIDEDLVVRPFGRKGNNATIREFDVGALQFHMGMQPDEIFPIANTDGDGDGISNEITVGEVSAMHIFQASLAPPKRVKPNQTKVGKQLFKTVGCNQCHIPRLKTDSKFLSISFPEVFTDPSANVFKEVNLAKPATGFKKDNNGPGIIVPLYADLKRHDMGPDLAESTGDGLDPFFTTARLWGVADTAPYLHDGRAFTLAQAILMHGGEAQQQRDNYAGLSSEDQQHILDFLGSLRAPRGANDDLLELLDDEQ